jgi:hypothetical protein
MKIIPYHYLVTNNEQMTNKDAIIEALAIIKGAKVYNVDFQNGIFACGKSKFSFELTKSGLIKSNSVRFLRAINEFKTDNKELILNTEANKKASVKTGATQL